MFPHSGAGALSMTDWLSDLPWPLECFAFQRPGREDRFGEPPFSSLSACVAESCDAMEPLLDRPYAFFGHSLGGYLAFQVAAQQRARGAPQAEVLCISAISPEVHSALRATSHRARLAHARAGFDEAGGMDEEALEELLGASQPAFEADLALYFDCEVEATKEVLETSVVAVCATRDASAPREAVSLWGTRTHGTFEILEVEGDHMYVATAARKRVADRLARSLLPHALGAP
ncbi:thioesterase II family protein [Sphingomonas sp. NCPPB 2930]